MRTWNIIVYSIVALIITACGSTGSPSGQAFVSGGSSGSTGNLTDDSTEDTPQLGGSTSAGNPTIDFSFAGAKALVATAETSTSSSSNLKKLVGTELQEVFALKASATTTKTAGSTLLPEVQQIFFGPSGVAAIVFTKAFVFEGSSCRFFRADIVDDSFVCIDTTISTIGKFVHSSPFNGVDDGYVNYDNKVKPVQFDAAGNIYYINSPYNNTLYRWNLATTSIDTITDKLTYIYIRKYIATTKGVFIELQVQEILDNVKMETSLNWIQPSGTVIDSPFKYVGEFILANETTLLVNGVHNDESAYGAAGLYTMELLDDTFGPAQIVMSDINPLDLIRYQKDADDYSYYGLGWEFQPDSTGTIYGNMTGCKSGNCGGGAIMTLFPSEPTFIDNPLGSTLRYFRLLSDILYITGIDSEGTERFMRMNPSDTAGAINLLPSKNIRIYNFILVDQVIIFDGRDLDTDQVLVGQIDMANNNALTEVSKQDATLLGLGAVNTP